MPPPDTQDRGASSAQAVPRASRSMLPRPAGAGAVAGRSAPWSARDVWTWIEVSPGGLLRACIAGVSAGTVIQGSTRTRSREWATDLLHRTLLKGTGAENVD